MFLFHYAVSPRNQEVPEMRFVITLLVLAVVCGSGKMTSPAMLAANKALVLLNAEEGSSRTLVKIQHVSMNEVVIKARQRDAID